VTDLAMAFAFAVNPLIAGSAAVVTLLAIMVTGWDLT